MVRYFYAWAPLVIVGTVFLLALPWLGLIALMIVSLVALAALVWLVVLVPSMLSRVTSRLWGSRTGASHGLKGSDNHVSPVVLASRNPDHALGAAHHPANGEFEAAPTSNTLFVSPTRRGGGFQASIRGHLLELAEPTGHGLAPTPDDLLIASIGSDLAWAARQFLRDHALADGVNVSAAWRTRENPWRLTDGSVTVAVPEASEAIRDALTAALEERLAARALDNRLRVGVRVPI